MTVRNVVKVSTWGPLSLLYLIWDTLFGVGPASMADTIGVSVICGFGLAWSFCLVTSRIEVWGFSFVVINALSTVTIPFEDVESLQADNGLQLRLHSGRTIPTMAFQQALISTLTGNRTARRAAQTLESESGWRVSTPSGYQQDTAVTTVRRGALYAIPIVVSGSVLYAQLLRALNT